VLVDDRALHVLLLPGAARDDQEIFAMTCLMTE